MTATPAPVSLPCLACGKVLSDAFAGQEHNQPNDAVSFRATGNYGSTIFDPMGTGEVLDINICDECLTAAAAKGHVNYARIRTTVEYRHEATWTGPGHGREGGGW